MKSVRELKQMAVLLLYPVQADEKPALNQIGSCFFFFFLQIKLSFNAETLHSILACF